MVFGVGVAKLITRLKKLSNNNNINIIYRLSDASDVCETASDPIRFSTQMTSFFGVEYRLQTNKKQYTVSLHAKRTVLSNRSPNMSNECSE